MGHLSKEIDVVKAVRLRYSKRPKITSCHHCQAPGGTFERKPHTRWEVNWEDNFDGPNSNLSAVISERERTTSTRYTRNFDRQY